MPSLLCSHSHLQPSTFQQRNLVMIKDIHIQNYRGIKDLKIKDFKRINLLVGDNNSGKTSVLESVLLMIHPRNPILLVKFDYYRNLDLTDGVLFENMNLNPQHFHDNFLWEKLSFNCFNKNTSNPISIKANESIKDSNEHLEIVFDLKTQNFNGENSINLNLNFNPTLPQSVIFKYSKNSENTGFSAGASAKISSEANKSICDAASLSRAGKIRSRDLVIRLSKFLKEKSENKQKLLNLISQIDSKIIDIFPDAERPKNSSIAIRINGLEGTITLDHFGDGIISVLTYVLAIYENKNSVVLIDEIENGLHWKTQTILWRAVIAAAAENNVQIIATTHSRDTIKALSEVYEKEKDLIGEDEIRLFKIKKDSEGLHHSLRYNSDMTMHVVEDEREVR